MESRLFNINDNMLQTLDDYHNKSLYMQEYHFDGNKNNLTLHELKNKVNDDLIFNVPIYDMLDRKYASFCSLLEALIKKENDVKKNGLHFIHVDEISEIDMFTLFYLFRLCGSGINYKPKIDDNVFKQTHGFGNFWIVDLLLENIIERDEWLLELTKINKPFTDNKGYMLPQFTFPGEKNHLKKYILDHSKNIVDLLYNFVTKQKREIYEITDFGNEYLMGLGFKRQNFVLTAFAMDIAEYYPHYADPMSRVYAGTNATKCLNTIFSKKERKIKEFDYLNDCMSFLAERYKTTPYSAEDSRACDVIRYIQEYQSQHHIQKNNGIIYTNNSILKNLIGHDEYYEISKNIK